MPVTPPEIERLYRAHAPRLCRAVGAGIGAPAATVEDACQVAWSRLLDHRQQVHRETALLWLTTTAVREAVRISQAALRECSLDESVGAAGDALRVGGNPSPAESYDRRERLQELRALPVRERRMMWLRGLGFSYDEIAAREGCTERVVERSLYRARKAARATA